jgi:cytochrome c oxidase cbb3-type subunit 4
MNLLLLVLLALPLACLAMLSFVAFLGIVAWAWGSGRRKAFDEAANAPFALPDEMDGISGDNSKRTGPKS